MHRGMVHGLKSCKIYAPANVLRGAATSGMRRKITISITCDASLASMTQKATPRLFTHKIY
jgi:hypothetical protein